MLTKYHGGSSSSVPWLNIQSRITSLYAKLTRQSEIQKTQTWKPKVCYTTTALQTWSSAMMLWSVWTGSTNDSKSRVQSGPKDWTCATSKCVRSTLRAAWTSTTHCRAMCCRTAIILWECTSQMWRSSCRRIPSWTARRPSGPPRSSWSTKGLTCCPSCWLNNYVVWGVKRRSWHFRVWSRLLKILLKLWGVSLSKV